jgi:hypothetical protein
VTKYLATGTTAAPFTLREDYDGDFIVPPGNAIIPYAIADTGGTFMQTLVWEEVPWP